MSSCLLIWELFSSISNEYNDDVLPPITTDGIELHNFSVSSDNLTEIVVTLLLDKHVNCKDLVKP